MNKAHVWIITQVLVADFIAAIVVGMFGGFGSGRSLGDYASGMLITGIALMAIGTFGWMRRVSPRNALNYDRMLGFENGIRFYLQERADADKSMNFWVVAGSLPFGIGIIIAVFGSILK